MLLNYYGNCSGQLINYDKSSIFFSGNVLEYNKADVYHILEVFEVDSPERYLGLPTIVGRNKRGAFCYLKEHFGDRTLSWSSKSLSQGGKEVFIKSVLQSIPLYTMNCFSE
ncbi:hypothetical protein V6N13_018612 [Hibiscus sabdariffa]